MTRVIDLHAHVSTPACEKLLDGPAPAWLDPFTRFSGPETAAYNATQFAALAGATVIATASTPEKRRSAREAGAHHVVDHRDPMAAQTIASLAGPGGVARIVDVAFGANLPLTSALIAPGGTIATYGSDAEPQPRLPFYPLMRKGVVIRTVLVFTMPPQAREAAVRDVTRWLASGALTHPVAQVYPLDRIAEAHEAVEKFIRGEVER